jgi:hypothetical protein
MGDCIYEPFIKKRNPDRWLENCVRSSRADWVTTIFYDIYIYGFIAFFIWMNRFCSPRSLPRSSFLDIKDGRGLWAALEANKFAVATVPHKGARLRWLGAQFLRHAGRKLNVEVLDRESAGDKTREKKISRS